MVEVTPSKDRAICNELACEVGKVRKRLAKKRKQAETSGRIRTRAKWPIESEAMAVDPEDIGKAREIAKRAGVSTEYTRTGEPILRSAAHRRAHCRAMGFYDRQAGFGDAAPLNR